MRNDADGNTFTTLVKPSTFVVDGGGLTVEKLALISEKMIEHQWYDSTRRDQSNR